MHFGQFVEHYKQHPLIRSRLFDFLEEDPGLLRRQVTDWLKKEWLLEVKRGVYVVKDPSRRCPASLYFLATHLVTPAYISLETALSYYQLIPERVDALTCITSKKTQRLHTPLGYFIYRHIKQSAYNFFVPVLDEFNRQFYIATAEKALIDYLYFHTSNIRMLDKDYFSEALRLQNTEILSMDRLIEAAKSFGQKKLIQSVETLIEFIKDEA